MEKDGIHHHQRLLHPDQGHRGHQNHRVAGEGVEAGPGLWSMTEPQTVGTQRPLTFFSLCCCSQNQVSLFGFSVTVLTGKTEV